MNLDDQLAQSCFLMWIWMQHMNLWYSGLDQPHAAVHR